MQGWRQMPTFDPQALEYLLPRRGALWRWSEQALAMEWTSAMTGSRTIAFRQEIRAVLAHLAPTGLPPFGAVVLLLAACRIEPQAAGEFVVQMRRAILETCGNSPVRAGTLDGHL